MLCLWAAAWPAAAAAGGRPLYCVLVPHFKDEYWLSVGYGLEEEARRQNADLLFFEAGGYQARAQQVSQLETCARRGASAILIGTVTSGHPELLQAIARVAPKIPVYGLVNELHSGALSGRIGVDWRDMGYQTGRVLALRHPTGSSAKTAVLITGPQEAGWTGPLETGLRNGLALSGTVEIAGVFSSDTGLRQQLALVEAALQQHPGADYLIGSAPAVEAAIGLLAAQPERPRPVLLATYVSHTVMRGLMNGSVLAVPYDDPMQQGILAIRLAASTLRTADPQRLIGPGIRLLQHSGSLAAHVRMSPPGYFPAIQ